MQLFKDYLISSIPIASPRVPYSTENHWLYLCMENFFGVVIAACSDLTAMAKQCWLSHGDRVMVEAKLSVIGLIYRGKSLYKDLFCGQ